MARTLAGKDDASVLKLLKQRTSSPVHAYYQDFEQYKRHNSIVNAEGEPVDAMEQPKLAKVNSKAKAKSTNK